MSDFFCGFLIAEAALKNARLEKEAADARIRELEAAAREVGWVDFDLTLGFLLVIGSSTRHLFGFFRWHSNVLSQAEERLAQMEKSLEQLRREVHSGVASVRDKMRVQDMIYGACEV